MQNSCSTMLEDMWLQGQVSHLSVKHSDFLGGLVSYQALFYFPAFAPVYSLPRCLFPFLISPYCVISRHSTQPSHMWNTNTWLSSKFSARLENFRGQDCVCYSPLCAQHLGSHLIGASYQITIAITGVIHTDLCTSVAALVILNYQIFF